MVHVLSIIATLAMFIYTNHLIENGIEGMQAVALGFTLLAGIFLAIRVISKQ